MGSAILKDGNPLGLQFIMFIPTILGQSTPEQLDKWLQRAMECSIVGTYAQVCIFNSYKIIIFAHNLAKHHNNFTICTVYVTIMLLFHKMKHGKYMKHC